MATTTPNKEIIRRICILSGGSICYLKVDTGDEYVDVLTDIEEKKLSAFLVELENWAGMKFRVYSLNNQTIERINIKENWEKILPIRIND